MHISVATLQHFLSTYGYLAVFLAVALESSGIPFPGETMLITAAAFAGAGHLQIPFVIMAAAAGAIGGDNCGYWIGRTGGRGVAVRFGKYIRLNERHLQYAEGFFVRHGQKTVFLGRFVAVMRTWTAFLAGLNRMPYPRFVVFDAAAGITWSTLFGLLAFKLGQNLPLLQKILKVLGVGGVALVIAIALSMYLLRRRARRAEAARDANDPQSGEAVLGRLEGEG